MRLRRFLARPPVGLIIPIEPVRNRVEAARCAKLFHRREQFVFAKETTLRVVAHIFRAIQLRSRDHFQRNCLLFRERNRIREMRTGEAGRIGNDGKHVLT